MCDIRRTRESVQVDKFRGPRGLLCDALGFKNGSNDELAGPRAFSDDAERGEDIGDSATTHELLSMLRSAFGLCDSEKNHRLVATSHAPQR